MATGTSTRTRGDLVCTTSVTDLGKRMPIATGICFLDHMVDQLVSHGQLGISVQVSLGGKPFSADADYAVLAAGKATSPGDPSVLISERPHDEAIFELVGASLGAALAEMAREVQGTGSAPPAAPSADAMRFCAPLDEAVSEAVVSLGGEGFAFALAPYGTIPPGGRTWIGTYRTALTEPLWRALGAELGGRVELRKLRGANAHHIVEASFKAFARAFRAHIDVLSGAWDARSAALLPEPSAAARRASHSRSTKETAIEVEVALDGAGGGGAVSTGIRTLDGLVEALREASTASVSVRCAGDLHIDDHHSIEDVGIALGQCLGAALGDKAGCNRMGCAAAAEGGAQVEVVVDLSNRPHYESDLVLDAEYTGDMASEMVEHFFDSLATSARSTVHVRQLARGRGPSACAELATATARALGLALRQCAAIDPRRAGMTASSKGTLSK